MVTHALVFHLFDDVGKFLDFGIDAVLGPRLAGGDLAQGIDPSFEVGRAMLQRMQRSFFVAQDEGADEGLAGEEAAAGGCGGQDGGGGAVEIDGDLVTDGGLGFGRDLRGSRVFVHGSGFRRSLRIRGGHAPTGWRGLERTFSLSVEFLLS